MKLTKPLNKRFVPLLVILAVFIAVIAIAAPTIAYYIRTSGAVDGEYGPADPYTISFRLDPDIGTKEMKNFQIEVKEQGNNNNHYPVYVRSTIIVTWQEFNDDVEDGTVYYVKPTEGDDYTIDINMDNWAELSDESSGKKYYYCTTPVNPYTINNAKSKGLTPVLINSLVLKATEPPVEGYVLNVEIIVQTIQAVGATTTGTTGKLAWQDAWGLDKYPTKPKD